MHSWADGKQGAMPFTVTSLLRPLRVCINFLCLHAGHREGCGAAYAEQRRPACLRTSCTTTRLVHSHGPWARLLLQPQLLAAVCNTLLGNSWLQVVHGSVRTLAQGRVASCRMIAISEPLPVLLQSTWRCKWVKTKALSNLLLALRNRLCPDSHRRGSWCALQWPGGFGRVGSAGASGRQAYLFRATQQLLVVTVHGSARDTVAVTSPPSPKYSRGNQPQCMHTSLRTWFELPTARIVSAPASTGNLSRRLRHR